MEIKKNSDNLCSKAKRELRLQACVPGTLCASRPLHYVYEDRPGLPQRQGGRQHGVGAGVLFRPFILKSGNLRNQLRPPPLRSKSTGSDMFIVLMSMSRQAHIRGNSNHLNVNHPHRPAKRMLSHLARGDQLLSRATSAESGSSMSTMPAA